MYIKPSEILSLSTANWYKHLCSLKSALSCYDDDDYDDDVNNNDDDDDGDDDDIVDDDVVVGDDDGAAPQAYDGRKNLPLP